MRYILTKIVEISDSKILYLENIYGIYRMRVKSIPEDLSLGSEVWATFYPSRESLNYGFVKPVFESQQ